MAKRKIVDGTFLGTLYTVLKEKDESQEKEPNKNNDSNHATSVQDTESKSQNERLQHNYR